MSAGISKKKSRPEIECAIEQLIQKHAEYYQGWLAQHIRELPPISLGTPVARHQTVFQGNAGSHLKGGRNKD